MSVIVTCTFNLNDDYNDSKFNKLINLELCLEYMNKYKKYIYIENLAYLINIAIENYYYKPIIDYYNKVIL